MNRMILILAPIVLLAGCERRETSTTSTQTPAQRDSVASAESRFDRIRNEIDSLDARVHTFGERAQAELHADINRLTAQRDSAAAELARLKGAGAEAWEKTKEETDRLLGGLENAIRAARERIRSRADTVSTASSSNRP